MREIYISFFSKQPVVCTGVFITIIPILLIFRRKAYIDPVFFILLIYLLIKLTIDLIMFHYAAFRLNNIIFENFTVIVRYCFFSAMFLYKLESKIYRRFLWATMIVFTSFSMWDFLVVNPNLSDFHNHKGFLYASTVECILMIFWTLLYFYETIKTLKIPNLLTYPFFWLCAGILLYYSSIVFIAPLFHYMLKWENWIDIGLLMYVPSIFESINMIFFSIGIWLFSTDTYARQ